MEKFLIARGGAELGEVKLGVLGSIFTSGKDSLRIQGGRQGEAGERPSPPPPPVSWSCLKMAPYLPFQFA